MKKIFIALLCLFLPVLLFAQKPPVKFGKVDDALVKMTSHPIDSFADAVVIMDYGETKFIYDQENGFTYQFERITRIKILTKDGLKYGDFEISYYHNNSSKEEVVGLKGYTYNYSNGSVEKSKLGKSSIFDEETDRNWDKKKISMPDVRVGSIVELTYTKRSPFTWNLVTWKFQKEIPTVHSEYIATIPEYYDYQLLQSGYHPNIKFNKYEKSGIISIQNKTRVGATEAFTNTKTTFSTENINYNNNVYKWVAKEVPGFEIESHVASPYDYLSKIKFELRGTKFPNSTYNEYMGTWNALNKTYLEASWFGEATQHAGFMKKELETISDLNSAFDKMAALVNLVRNQIEWNEQYSQQTSSTLRKVWTDKKGSSSEINLIIVAGLRKLGFETDPVLISTRGNGMIRDRYAISNQFNSVIAMVKIENEIILMDGTDRNLPVDVLPIKCLNGKGWRVSETAPGWVQIRPSKNQQRVFQASFTMNTGGLAGEVVITNKGYTSYSAHKKIKNIGDEKYFEEVQSNNPSWLIEDYQYNSETGVEEPFKSTYNIELNEELTLTEDIIYFNPTLSEVLNENPFKIEIREYPVDFAFPIHDVYMFKFHIPEGYKVDEFPKSIAFALPNKAAAFKYNISSQGNTVQLIADFRINKTMFSQAEYPVLKKFYDQVVQKCEEQIVLVKIN